MIFYIYFDPDIIADVRDRGTYAVKHLQDIVKGLSINCSIITFEDYHQITEIGELVNQLPDSFERTELKALFSFLQKNNRFISCLIPDYNGRKSDLNCLNEQYLEQELDLILLSLIKIDKFEWNIETATIDTYNESNFERSRFQCIKSGKTISDGEYDALVFLNLFFRKLLLNAKQIEICDYSFGANFRDDYVYSWKIFIHWLNSFVNVTTQIKMIIHCDKGHQSTANYMIGELKRHLPPNINNIEILLKYYLPYNSRTALPHERYIFTEQFAFNIGRGMDFFKQANAKNRKTALSYMNIREVRKAVDDCINLLDNPSEIKIC